MNSTGCPEPLTSYDSSTPLTLAIGMAPSPRPAPGLDLQGRRTAITVASPHLPACGTSSLESEEATVLSETPHNLPSRLTSFVGRERELAEIAALVAARRLVTLVGAPGVGKSRLSLQIA